MVMAIDFNVGPSNGHLHAVTQLIRITYSSLLRMNHLRLCIPNSYIHLLTTSLNDNATFAYITVLAT